MTPLKFKTNINCAACVARVTPVLNKTFGEGNWHVDVGNAEKILTVAAAGATPTDVTNALKKTGFTGEEL